MYGGYQTSDQIGVPQGDMSDSQDGYLTQPQYSQYPQYSYHDRQSIATQYTESPTYQPGQWGQAPQGTYTQPASQVSYVPSDQIRQELKDYFAGIYCVKVETNRGQGVYYAKIFSFLGNDNRYLVVTVPNDNSPDGTQMMLQNMNFSSIQTRTIPTDYDMPPQQYQKNYDTPLKNYRLQSRGENTMSRTQYYSYNAPIEVVLLHDSKAKSRYQYPDTIPLHHALETYQCVVSFR